VYTPTPDIVALAFDLGRPTSDLVHVRRGDTDTWRLDTTTGSYLIKGYWTGPVEPLLFQLETEMSIGSSVATMTSRSGSAGRWRRSISWSR
jgi:hypothetical protein